MLEGAGKEVYDSRAKYMVDENAGLTVTYNKLKDPKCEDPRILDLRWSHEEMDRKVLEAYAQCDPDGRWLELEVPPFCPLNDDDRKKLEVFENAVIDRLFVLNAKRAEEEKRAGLGVKGGKKPAPAKTPAAKAPAKKAAGATAGETKPRARRKKPEGAGPLLPGVDQAEEETES